MLRIIIYNVRTPYKDNAEGIQGKLRDNGFGYPEIVI